ncbi:hypothetical protein [Sphingomonas sp. TX0522]|uniref:hypothetical protein n=1 Tax=Sphingomonas sp. TX0522 TaxID=2479205 RepID=UPI0018E05243|nr:hypothetical protein [Sphingomonas sp. TX0522]
MTIDLSDFKLTPLPSRETPPYASADPSTDLRLLLAGTDWSEQDTAATRPAPRREIG